MKKLNWISLICVMLFYACSGAGGGDNNPVEPTVYNIAGELTIKNGENWNSSDKVIFRMFKYGVTQTPDVSLILQKPTSGNKLSFSISDIERAKYQTVQIIYVKNNDAENYKILADYGEVVISQKDNGLPAKEIDFSAVAKITFSMIQKDLFNPYCVSCHTTNNKLGDLDLSEGKSYKAMVNVKAVFDTNYVLVVPGDAEKSYLVMTLTGANSSPLMPPKPLTKFTDSQIEMIKTWINNGAKDD